MFGTNKKIKALEEKINRLEIKIWESTNSPKYKIADKVITPHGNGHIYSIEASASSCLDNDIFYYIYGVRVDTCYILYLLFMEDQITLINTNEHKPQKRTTKVGLKSRSK